MTICCNYNLKEPDIVIFFLFLTKAIIKTWNVYIVTVENSVIFLNSYY